VHRVGRLLRFDRDEVLAWLGGKTTPTVSTPPAASVRERRAAGGRDTQRNRDAALRLWAA
jgi:hypothetical protein